MSSLPASAPAGMTRGDRLAHLVITAAVALIAVAAIANALSFPASPDPNDVGAARFPILYSVGILGLAALLLWQTLSAPLRPQAGATGERPHYGRAALGVLAMLLAVAAIGTIGYAITGFLLLAGLMAVMGQRSLIWNPLIALGITAIIYFLFDYGLNVPLPPGSLFE